MNCLVTGGAGFIGSHLVDHLLSQGYRVVALDNLSTGRRSNLQPALANRNFRLVVGSVWRSEIVEPLIAQADVVYHLAASVGVKRIMDRLVESIENNIRGTDTVLRLASRRRVKVLLTSSSEVYGRSTDRPFREDDDLRMGPPDKARWSYAGAKALDEYLALAYWRQRDLPVTIVRLFNTVGRRQLDCYGMVLPTFVNQAVRGRPLTIYGSGRQSRCFCLVNDVVVALRLLMENRSSHGQVYNVGSNQEISIDRLADWVIDLAGSSSRKQYYPYHQVFRPGFDDIDRRVPDLTKIASAIGWRPTADLDQIIRQLLVAARAESPVGQPSR